jgi:predicted GNAT family acetyltransferase
MAEVQHDKIGHRFFIPLASGHEALLLYRQQGDTLDFTHTYVPEPFREKGLAEKVVEAGFRYAQENHLKVIPTCPYVSQYFLRKRPEFSQLVASH